MKLVKFKAGDKIENRKPVMLFSLIGFETRAAERNRRSAVRGFELADAHGAVLVRRLPGVGVEGGKCELVHLRVVHGHEYLARLYDVRRAHARFEFSAP